MFSHTVLMSGLISGLLASCAIGLVPAGAEASAEARAQKRDSVLSAFVEPARRLLAQEAPMDLPGRPPVDPLEFPTETPVLPDDIEHEDIEHEVSEVGEPEEGTAGQGAIAEEPSVEAPAIEESVVEEPVVEERAESVSVPWRKFDNEAGKFRVAMPSQPARYQLATAAGVEESQMYMQMQLVDGAHLEIYAAAFVESAGFLRSQLSREAALLDCVSNLGDLPERSAPRYISLADERGVEMTFWGAAGAFQVSRCYLVGDRAYMLTASREAFDAGQGLLPLPQVAPQTAERIEVRSAGMDVFFDSFEILD